MSTNGIMHRSTLTLLAAYLGLFVGLVDANAINLALPAVRDDLGGGISGAQWTIDAYNITFAAVLLSAGSLGDRFGRRRLLRIGLTSSSSPRWPARPHRRSPFFFQPGRYRASARR
jgi:MFS transporter, DHA2 family, methylenomycin A resistance protein